MGELLWNRANANEDISFDQERQELSQFFDELETSIERAWWKIRPLQTLWAWCWKFPFDMKNPPASWDFYCTYDAEYWKMHIRGHKYSTDTEWNVCVGEERPLLIDEYIVIGENQQTFLENLWGLLDKTELSEPYFDQNPDKHRPKSRSKWVEMYKKIQDFDKLYNNDFYRYFVLKKWTWLLEHLRDTNTSEGLWMDEVRLAYLAKDLKVDSWVEHIPDNDLSQWAPFLLTRSTLSHHLPYFGEIGRDKLWTFIDVLIKNETILPKDKDALIAEIEEWNQDSLWRIVIFKSLIEKYLTPKFSWEAYKPFDVLLYNAKKKKYKVDWPNSKFTKEFVLESYEKLKDSLKILQEIPEEDRFSLYLNAVLDFNVWVDRHWKAEQSNFVYIPQKPTYFERYFKQHKQAKILAPSISKEVHGLEQSSVSHLLENGLHWQFHAWKTAKIAEENYNYMKVKFTWLPISSANKQWRFEYVKQKFASSKKLTPMMKKFCPYIPMQETWYKNNLKSWVWAEWLRQFMPKTWVKYWLKNGSDRKNMVKSTQASIDSLADNYTDTQNNPNFVALTKKYNNYFPSWKEKDLLITMFAINAHNSWQGHVNRVLAIMNWVSKFKRPDDKKVVDAYMKKHGALWLFVFFTDHYSKHSSNYQDYDTFKNTKYLIESPQYVYNILKYYQLDTVQEQSTRDVSSR